MMRNEMRNVSDPFDSKGVTRTNLTAEDKVWMLESLTGQNVQKSAIEAANFDELRSATA